MGFFSALAGLSPLPAQEDLLLDDFTSRTASSFGTAWEGFTDRVMGGISDLQSRLVSDPEGNYLRMEGRVRLENNGGFIQMRLGLEKEGKTLDARPWAGIRLTARGLPGTYSLHLRTTQNWFPWNFYTARLPVTPEWQEVKIPFSAFKGDYGAWGEMDLKTLRSLAVVAIGTAFEARLDVQRIGFYR